MCSRFRSVIAAVAVAGAAALMGSARTAAAPHSGTPGVLRVCSDPNNLPFSNAREQGFENRIARLMAGALGARLEYTWHAQRRGFIRNTLNARVCDVVIGIPHDLDAVDTTRAYYRSTHVFVTRARESLLLRSLDDPRLARLRIGVHVVGDDYASLPPLQALGRRGLVRNVSGYSLYGNYAEADPPARVIEAVASGAVDVAVVWGPLGGYYAPRQKVPLRVTAMTPDTDSPSLPLSYAIAMGVRKGDDGLRKALQTVLDARQSEVEAILRRYGVPLKPVAALRAGA